VIKQKANLEIYHNKLQFFKKYKNNFTKSMLTITRHLIVVGVTRSIRDQFIISLAKMLLSSFENYDKSIFASCSIMILSSLPACISVHHLSLVFLVDGLLTVVITGINIILILLGITDNIAPHIVYQQQSMHGLLHRQS
jgi:hypothetical protein